MLQFKPASSSHSWNWNWEERLNASWDPDAKSESLQCILSWQSVAQWTAFWNKNQSFMDSSSVDYYQREWKQGVQKTMNLSRNRRKKCFQQLKCMDLKLSGMGTPSATLLCQKPRKRAETNVELNWMVCWCLCGFNFLGSWNDEPRSKCRKCYVFLNTFETNFRTCAYDNFVFCDAAWAPAKSTSPAQFWLNIMQACHYFHL